MLMKSSTQVVVFVHQDTDNHVLSVQLTAHLSVLSLKTFNLGAKTESGGGFVRFRYMDRSEVDFAKVFSTERATSAEDAGVRSVVEMDADITENMTWK